MVLSQHGDSQEWPQAGCLASVGLCKVILATYWGFLKQSEQLTALLHPTPNCLPLVSELFLDGLDLRYVNHPWMGDGTCACILSCVSGLSRRFVTSRLVVSKLCSLSGC